MFPLNSKSNSNLKSAEKIKNYYHLVLCIVGLAGMFAADGLAQIRILAQDDAGITVEYRPEYPPPVDLGDGIVRLNLNNGDVEKVAGQPKIPVYMLNIAVPPGAKPTARLLQYESGERWRGRLPVFQPAEVDGAYFAPHPRRHSGVIGAVELRSFAGVNLARIPVYPAAIEANGVELARRIVIRVDFNAPPRINVQKPLSITNLHRLVLINADQAAGWGKMTTSSFQPQSWPQGDIYRFEIDDEGIYRLGFEDLTGSNVTIPPGGVPSGRIKLFGNGGYELPEPPNAPAPLGLDECAIYIHDGGDGQFGLGDWMLFYGRGASSWTVDTSGSVRYAMHHYALRNHYWLVIDPVGGGKRMSGFNSEQSPARSFQSTAIRQHFEPEKFIFGNSMFPGSGVDWYGYTLEGNTSIAFTLFTAGVDAARPIVVGGRIVNPSYRSTPRIFVKLNGVDIGDFVPESYSSLGEWNFNAPGSAIRESANSIAFEQTGGSNAQSLFDWLELAYFGFLDRQRAFESESVGSEVVEYRSSNMAEPWFFDITDHNRVRVEHRASVKVQQTNAKRRFILLNTSDFRAARSPIVKYAPPSTEVPNLWSSGNRADVILITPDSYYESLKPLVEHLARRDPPLIGARIRAGEIYDHFSGGLKDPGAIRNLLHYAKDYWSPPQPRYVIFCGDGDYNYRDFDRSRQPDLLPPYEAAGLCTDDWFCDFTPFISDGVREPLPEMVHGRLPAQSVFELDNIIAKIIAYEEEPEFGLWRNRIVLVADDEYGEGNSIEPEHIRGNEDISLNCLPIYLDRIKIYLTEYARQWGRVKPQSGEDLLANINNGVLLVNYMGHGNPTLWAHEHVFVQSRDFPRIEPSRRLPLYLAFTCDWAYWDDPSGASFAEQLLTAAGRGAIGAIASTRLTYAYSNTALARNFFLNQFGNERLTTGEALWRGKYQVRGSNSASYHLLGDPTLYLGQPRLRGQFVSLAPYPIIPLAVSGLSGRIVGTDGAFLPTFRGELEFILRDAAVARRYKIIIDSDPPSEITLNYSIPGATIYRGFLSVRDGIFNGNFIAPRDVTLGDSTGRAVGYFHDAEIDGVIARDSIVYASQMSAGTDAQAPAIKIYFDSRSYRPGDRIRAEPLLIVDITDSSGLNLTGALGHGVNLRVDGGSPRNITNQFRYNLDSHQSGSLEQRIGPLETGLRRIEIEAWDSYNNMAVKEVEVEVEAGAGGLLIDRVLNWPNPFRTTTALTFIVNQSADYEVKIFTVNGRPIWQRRGSASTGGIVTDIIWDGRDSAGRQAGNGVYLYKVTAWNSDGEKAEGLGKIAYIR